MSKSASKPDSTDSSNEWAVILAGGDGTRLKSLTRKIAGDERPKQFCSVLGKVTLLEDTRTRAALELARQRTLYVVNRIHESYYLPILGNEPASNLVLQPSNRGTAPAILYSLLRIAAVDPHAVVAFLPSYHYVSDNEKFMTYIRAALEHCASPNRFGSAAWIGSGKSGSGIRLDRTGGAHPRSIANLWRSPLLGETPSTVGSGAATARLLVEQFCDGRLGSGFTRNRRKCNSPTLHLVCRARAFPRHAGGSESHR
jgi:Nucleotidyl transferase